MDFNAGLVRLADHLDVHMPRLFLLNQEAWFRKNCRGICPCLPLCHSYSGCTRAMSDGPLGSAVAVELVQGTGMTASLVSAIPPITKSSQSLRMLPKPSRIRESATRKRGSRVNCAFHISHRSFMCSAVSCREIQS